MTITERRPEHDGEIVYSGPRRIIQAEELIEFSDNSKGQDGSGNLTDKRGFVIADGMQPSGGAAALAAVQANLDYMDRIDTRSEFERMYEPRVGEAARGVRQALNTDALQAAGANTTFLSLMLAEPPSSNYVATALTAHVGDSRAFEVLLAGYDSVSVHPLTTDTSLPYIYFMHRKDEDAQERSTIVQMIHRLLDGVRNQDDLMQAEDIFWKFINTRGRREKRRSIYEEAVNHLWQDLQKLEEDRMLRLPQTLGLVPVIHYFFWYSNETCGAADYDPVVTIHHLDSRCLAVLLLTDGGYGPVTAEDLTEIGSYSFRQNKSLRTFPQNIITEAVSAESIRQRYDEDGELDPDDARAKLVLL